jgi:hypothetical protein
MRRSIVPAYPHLSEPRLPARRGAWVALSTNPSVLPFAGAPLERDFALSGEIADRLPSAPLYLRVFRASDGRTLETFIWRKV